MGLLEQCEPWVQELFSLLEKEFRPHDLVQSVVKHLNFMKSENRFSEYCYGIEELLIIRLCQQLSKVSVRLSMHIQCFPSMPLLFVALSLCCFENMFDDRPGATTTTANKKKFQRRQIIGAV